MNLSSLEIGVLKETSYCTFCPEAPASKVVKFHKVWTRSPLKHFRLYQSQILLKRYSNYIRVCVIWLAMSILTMNIIMLQVQSRREARPAAMGVRTMRARSLHLPEPGRHRRQAGATHRQPVAAGRALWPRLRQYIHRVYSARRLYSCQTRRVPYMDVLPGKFSHYLER